MSGFSPTRPIRHATGDPIGEGQPLRTLARTGNPVPIDVAGIAIEARRARP